jgi:hypothetical protein
MCFPGLAPFLGHMFTVCQELSERLPEDPVLWLSGLDPEAHNERTMKRPPAGGKVSRRMSSQWGAEFWAEQTPSLLPSQSPFFYWQDQKWLSFYTLLINSSRLQKISQVTIPMWEPTFAANVPVAGRGHPKDLRCSEKARQVVSSVPWHFLSVLCYPIQWPRATDKLLGKVCLLSLRNSTVNSIKIVVVSGYPQGTGSRIAMDTKIHGVFAYKLHILLDALNHLSTTYNT